MPSDECGRVLYMLSQPDAGLTAEMVTDLSAMSRELCEEIRPCEAEPVESLALNGHCDPRDICSACDGVAAVASASAPTPAAPDAPVLHPEATSAVLASCMAAVNWACCSSEPAARNCYVGNPGFCDGVPEAGWSASSVTYAQLSTITSWQNSSCASRTSALGLQAGAARRSVQQAQGAAAALNLLASMPSPGATDADLQGWTSTLRQQLTARPCDPALRSSAHTLLSSLLGRSESLSGAEPVRSFPRARMSPPEAAAASRLRPGREWSVLRPD